MSINKESDNKREKLNKWYTEANIPIRMNSSTLIRIRNNSSNSGAFENTMRKSTNNNQLEVTANSYLKREQKMLEFRNQNCNIANTDPKKTVMPFDKYSYIKNICLSIVSTRAEIVSLSRATISSIYPAGDSVTEGYNSISALSINDLKFSCNVKFYEAVSFQSRKELENQRAECNAKICNNSYVKLIKQQVTPPISFTHTKGYPEQNRLLKIKQCIKKNKKPVVVTCLKNSSIKYVKRK